MTRFLQICASQNDLFGLDDEGDVYQYNFNTKTWIQLAQEQSHAKGAERGRPEGN